MTQTGGTWPDPPQSPGGSDSFIDGLGPTLVATDYSSPSLTGCYAKAGVSSLTCLPFRATDSSALLTGGVRLDRGGKRKSR